MQMNKVTVKPLGLGQITSSKVYLLFGDTHKKLKNWENVSRYFAFALNFNLFCCHRCIYLLKKATFLDWCNFRYFASNGCFQ